MSRIKEKILHKLMYYNDTPLEVRERDLCYKAMKIYTKNLREQNDKLIEENTRLSLEIIYLQTKNQEL